MTCPDCGAYEERCQCAPGLERVLHRQSVRIGELMEERRRLEAQLAAALTAHRIEQEARRLQQEAADAQFGAIDAALYLDRPGLTRSAGDRVRAIRALQRGQP